MSQNHALAKKFLEKPLEGFSDFHDGSNDKKRPKKKEEKKEEAKKEAPKHESQQSRPRRQELPEEAPKKDEKLIYKPKDPQQIPLGSQNGTLFKPLPGLKVLDPALMSQPQFQKIMS